MKEKLAASLDNLAVENSMEQGSMPRIHVSIGQLTASKPPVRPGAHGD